MDKKKIYWAKTKENATIPTKKIEDAGYDIYACFDHEFILIEPNSTQLISTGIATAVSSDYFVKVEERGSTGSKGIKKSAGIIDSGYRGEIFIAITNANGTPLLITDLTMEEFKNKYCILEDGMWRFTDENRGVNDKIFVASKEKDFMTIYPKSKAIAQLVVLPVPKLKAEEVTYEELCSFASERGTGALGSTKK